MARGRSRSRQVTATHSAAGSVTSPLGLGEREVRVQVNSSIHIVDARQQGRALAAMLGFSSSDLTIIATAISEVGRNMVEYAGEGYVIITPLTGSRRKGVEIVAVDLGPGIEDIAAVMRDGYSTSQGMGIGLPGARRLMDEFEIVSAVGKGTTVTMRKWVE